MDRVQCRDCQGWFSRKDVLNATSTQCTCYRHRRRSSCQSTLCHLRLQSSDKGILSSSILFNCEYIGLHMLWQDVFLQDVFATLSKDDMTNSQKNC